MKRLLIPAAAILAISCGTAAQAKPKKHDHGQGSDAGQSASVARLSFGDAAEREIRSYFRTNSYDVQSLPPGIAKNLARGKPLPPGIAKRFPPEDLRRRLPDYPGCEVLIVDRDVLLVDLATRVIVDVLSGVL